MKTYSFPLNIQVKLTVDEHGVRQAEILPNKVNIPDKSETSLPDKIPTAYDLMKRKELEK